MKFPIKVKISIYQKKDGGKDIIRKDTDIGGRPIVFNEFRGVIQIKLFSDKKETNWSTFFELPKTKEFLTGHEYITGMTILAINNNEIKNSLYVGQKFKLWESGIFGEGEILEILDEEETDNKNN